MADLGRVSKRRDRCETKAGGESVKRSVATSLR